MGAEPCIISLEVEAGSENSEAWGFELPFWVIWRKR